MLSTQWQEDKHDFLAYQETAHQARDEHQESRQAGEDDGPEGEVWGDKCWAEPVLSFPQGSCFTPVRQQSLT